MGGGGGTAAAMGAAGAGVGAIGGTGRGAGAIVAAGAGGGGIRREGGGGGGKTRLGSSAAASPGELADKPILAVPCGALPTPPGGTRGGSVMRTVSFFGPFKSLMVMGESWGARLGEIAPLVTR